ncbi:DUF6053 domain-containing protein [Lysobacter enzymogenes]|uniref:DUF6053 domain-containing protein n=1 Tax=Lysobacter enzymogenes TaxID=69 RepID=UPI003D18903D
MGGPSGPMLFSRFARCVPAALHRAWNKSIGAEAPPTTACGRAFRPDAFRSAGRETPSRPARKHRT